MGAAEQIDRTELDELERIISDGLRTFVDVGRALARIRDGKLYRETHKTFESYCRERWGFTRMRAHQLIEAAAVTENVNHGLQKPPNERQARELGKLPDNEQAEAWAEAVETAPDGKVTAKHVAEVVGARLATFHCPECAETFSAKVWHCPGCAHHWPMDRDECWNCHNYRSSWERIGQEDAEADEEEWVCPRCGERYPMGVYPQTAKLCGACADTSQTPRAKEPTEEPIARVLVSDLERLISQREADPDYRSFRDTQRAVASAMPPSRGQRIMAFVLDGGELALLRLGLDWTVTRDALRSAYRDAARVAHPDRGGSQDEFQKVTRARDLIVEMLGENVR